MPPRPRIGVTGPERGGVAAWLFTRYQVWRSGGRAVWIRPHARRSIEGVDGLIIGGGEDVAPELYGERPQKPLEDLRRLRRTARGLALSWLERAAYPLVYCLRWLFQAHRRPQEPEARDRLESELIRQALERRVPLLGICRGAQLLNVCLGGSLHQDVAGLHVETPQVRSILPVKKVSVAPGSKLAAITGLKTFRVNALHRQAVKKLGSGLRVAAAEPNSVIQAIEHHSADALGVQWHPEYLLHHGHQRRLFRHLVEAAGRRSEGQETTSTRAESPG